MRKFGWLLLVAALAATAGCGGSSSSFATVSSSSSSSSSSSGGTTAAKVAAVSVVTSQPQIPSNGSASATITAFVRDANNQFISGVPVLFKSTSGGLAVTTATTDAGGQATATLDTAGDPTNRTITVTATAGAQSATVGVGVVGTSVAVSGPASLVSGNAGTYTVSLTDSAGAPISGQSVAVASSKGNTLSASSVTTDTSGHATFTVTGSVAGTDTITVTVLGQSAATDVTVSNQNFAFTAPAANTLVALGANQTVTLVWTNGGTAQTGQTITFSTTRGTFNGGSNPTATAVTDGTGTAQVTIAAATAGPAIITASSSGVSAQVALTFVATNPHAIDLQASPATVSTQGQSTITAIVRDINNNLVEGQTVAFQLTDVTGGSLSVGSAVTDVQGKAQTVYTASSVASATNGVTITASVPAVPAVTPTTVSLTVGGQAVFLSLGTGEVISENSNKTQFIMPFVVQAQDAGGNAVNGVPITLTVRSVQYAKGGYYNFNSAWVQTGVPNPVTAYSTLPLPAITVCANEDVNNNGILDPGEDFNNNLRLDPGNVAAVSPGSVTTAPTTISNGTSTTTVNGSAALVVVYPEDHANWVQVVLTATATVSGTETTTTSTFWLPILATYLTTVTSSPPGFVSPYGTATSCANPN